MDAFLNWWRHLPPDSQDKIIVALVTAIATAVLTNYVPKMIWPMLLKAGGWIKEIVYRNLAGFLLFNRWGLVHYRKALRADLERVVNPWSYQKQLLENIFVPIKVETKYNLPQLVPEQKRPESLVDLREAAREYQRFVLVGEPGAGKSTALRSLGLAALDGRLYPAPDNILPVYIELRRYTQSELTLEDYLPIVFRRYGFPNASKFIQRSLANGRLQLLLDGLDEVSEEQFHNIIERVREFCSSYEDNHVIVSCRTAAYERQLDDLSYATIALTHFNNIQIVGFLRHWAFPQNKSSVDLMRILNDRPRILSICRNPLMLTIIASLYAETDYELPSSRVEFYRTCVDAVLKRWDRARQVDRYNRFHASIKMRVLQRLALNLQESSDTGDIKLPDLIKFITGVLPDIGLSTDLAEDVLNEIVRNSGLLIYVGPQRLRFAHLTFQEFFAAMEINDSGSASLLLEYFDRNPRKWREVCLLYCGTSSRSNDFIANLSRLDLIMAANCVADGEGINVELAKSVIEDLIEQTLSFTDLERRVIAELKERGLNEGALEDTVVLNVDRLHNSGDVEKELHALSLLAADQNRVWANQAFNFLRTFLHEAVADSHRYAAITALANVTSEAAARELVAALQQAETKEVAKRAIVQLGVVGVPALRQVLSSTRDKQLQQMCLEICSQIPYPEVIDIIVPLLDDDDPMTRATAGWAIGVLIQDPAIEHSLQLLKPTDLRSSRQDQGLVIRELSKWVWPFETEENSAMRTIIAKVVSCLSPNLIDDVVAKNGLGNRIDPRIGIPVSIQLFQAHNSISLLNESFKRTAGILLAGDAMAWELRLWPPHTMAQSWTVNDFSIVPRIFESNAEFLKESWAHLLEKKKGKYFSFSADSRSLARSMSALQLLLLVLLTIIWFGSLSKATILFGLILTAMGVVLTLFWSKKLNQSLTVSLLSLPLGGFSYARDLLDTRANGWKNVIWLSASLIFILLWSTYTALLNPYTGLPLSLLIAFSYVLAGNILFAINRTRQNSTNPWLMFLRAMPSTKLGGHTAVNVKGQGRENQLPSELFVYKEDTTPTAPRYVPDLSNEPTVINAAMSFNQVERDADLPTHRSTVLARSEQPRNSRRNETIAIGCMALGLLTAMSLLSYNVNDYALAISEQRQAIHNLVGPAGTYFAHYSFRTVGLAALLIPLLLIAAAWVRFRTRRIRSLSSRLLWAGNLILAAASLLALYGTDSPSRFSFLPGGVFGAMVLGLLSALPSSLTASLISLWVTVSLMRSLNLSWAQLYRSLATAAFKKQ